MRQTDPMRSNWTAESFLAWAEDRPDGMRHELVNGEVVATAPERNRHNLVKMDCWSALQRSVEVADLDCAVLGDGATVVVSDTDVYEPDVTIQCGEPIDLDAVTISHPVILVEVLSPGTRSVDTHAKLTGYFSLSSVQHYLVVDPLKRVVIHHQRSGEGIDTAILHEGELVLDPPGLRADTAGFFRSV